MVKARSSHWRCSMKKASLKNVTIFTGKHLCWRLFSCEYDAKHWKQHVLKNICERMILIGRHWSSTNEILKFYFIDKMEVPPFYFSWFFIRVIFSDNILFCQEIYISTQEILQILLMNEAVFKCDKSSISL